MFLLCNLSVLSLLYLSSLLLLLSLFRVCLLFVIKKKKYHDEYLKLFIIILFMIIIIINHIDLSVISLAFCAFIFFFSNFDDVIFSFTFTQLIWTVTISVTCLMTSWMLSRTLWRHDFFRYPVLRRHGFYHVLSDVTNSLSYLMAS